MGSHMRQIAGALSVNRSISHSVRTRLTQHRQLSEGERWGVMATPGGVRHGECASSGVREAAGVMVAELLRGAQQQGREGEGGCEGGGRGERGVACAGGCK